MSSPVVSTLEETAEFRASVPRTLMEEFKSHYPYHGVVSWCAEEFLREMVAAAKEDPTAKERVRIAVRNMTRGK